MKYKDLYRPISTQNVVERTAKKLGEKKDSPIYSTPVSRALKKYYPMVRNSFVAAAATVTSCVLGVSKAAFNKVAGGFLYYGFLVFFSVCLVFISRKIIYFVLRKLIKLFFATIFAFFSKLTSGSKKLTKKFRKNKKTKT